ncbi:MAG: hypothetical protein IJX17_06710 [Clostridia bacterium]|nr:hypothetical protein [Clostridia bacterium]
MGEIQKYKKLVGSFHSLNNYSYHYPKTKFRKLSDNELGILIHNTEELLARPNNEVLQIFQEYSLRFAKSHGIPLKKVTVKDGPIYNDDDKEHLVEGAVGYEEMFFVKYPLKYYQKYKDISCLGKYNFLLTHENRHAYQWYRFKHCDKNTFEYARIQFLKNENLMRNYLSMHGKEDSIPKDDYRYNSMERDANYYAISNFMGIVRYNRANVTKSDLEFIINQMLEFNKSIDGKEASFLQMRNYSTLYTNFKSLVGEEAYNKLAKKYSLEDVTIVDLAYEGFQKRENIMQEHLYDALNIYYNFVKEILPKGYAKEKFDKLI